MNTNNTKVFGILVLISGLVALGIGSYEFTMDISILNLLPLVSGMIIIFCGYSIHSKYSDNKLYTIGIYAMTIGLSNVITAIGLLIVAREFFIISLIYLIIGISFITTGLSFMGGTSKKIVRMILTNAVLILFSGFIAYNAFLGADTFRAIEEMIEVFISILFIVLLLSSDVRNNTKRAKKKQKNCQRYERVPCGRHEPYDGRKY